MSRELWELALRFVAGDVAAPVFADVYIAKWKQERDSGKIFGDSDVLSECLSSILCLADLYNPASTRDAYELDELQLVFEVTKLLEQVKDAEDGEAEAPADTSQ